MYDCNLSNGIDSILKGTVHQIYNIDHMLSRNNGSKQGWQTQIESSFPL